MLLANQAQRANLGQRAKVEARCTEEGCRQELRPMWQTRQMQQTIVAILRDHWDSKATRQKIVADPKGHSQKATQDQTTVATRKSRWGQKLRATTKLQ